MSEIILFHHAQGLTKGVRAFADDLSAAGHTVHVPDLFDGRTTTSSPASLMLGKSGSTTSLPGV